MIKVLIVDDRDVIRTSLQNLKIWKENDMEVIGDASNGIDAVKLINNLKPDIVITDVKMPLMDGIELSKYIYENYGNIIKIMILSAYDEFGYAQKAMKYGVTEYLLKPVKQKELFASILNIKEEVLKSHQQNISIEKFKTLQPFALEKVINDYLELKIDCVNLVRNVKMISPDMENGFFMSLIISINSYISIKDTLNIEEFGKFLKNIFCKDLIYISSEKSMSLLLLRYNEIPKKNMLNDFFSWIGNEINKNFNITVSLFIGDIYEGIPGIKVSFEESMKLYKRRIIFEYNQNYFYNRINFLQDGKQPEKSYIEFDTIIKNIILSIMTNEIENIELILAEVIKIYCNFKWIEEFYKFLADLISTVSKLLLSIGIDKSHLDIFNEELASCIEQDNIKSLTSKYISTLKEISDFMNENSNLKAKSAVYYAKRIINDQFENKDLNLQYVCKKLFINESYFCQIFKAQTGETFNDILTRTKLTKALELLKTTDLKIYEIADKLGFSNQYYFTTVFSKVYGISPKNMKKEMLLKKSTVL